MYEGLRCDSFCRAQQSDCAAEACLQAVLPSGQGTGHQLAGQATGLIWDLDVNLSKTKVVVFRRPGQARLARTWQFAGRTVEVADSYKYLGTVFHETKLLKQASQQLAAAGQRALYAVKSMCYQQDITDPSLRLHFWQQLVLPVVSFGSEMWAGLYPFFDDASYMANNPA